MRRCSFVLVAGLAASLAACMNQGNTQGRGANSTRASDANPSVQLIGCLTQGSSPDTFRLENARLKSESKASDALPSSPTTYTLVAATDRVKLADQLNHEVEVSGKRDASTASTTEPPVAGSSGAAGSTGSSPVATGSTRSTTPAQDRPVEAQLELTRFVVNSVSSIADRCTAPTR